MKLTPVRIIVMFIGVLILMALAFFVYVLIQMRGYNIFRQI
jgi:hypothetical protein